MRTSTSTHLQLGKLPEELDERKIVIRAEKFSGKNLMARAQNAQPELKKLFKQRMRCYKTFDAKVTEAISAQCADAKLIFEAIGRYRQKEPFNPQGIIFLLLQFDVIVPNSLQNALKPRMLLFCPEESYETMQ